LPTPANRVRAAHGPTIDRGRLDYELLIRNLTPRQVARRIGITEPTMSRIRSGECSPRPSTVARIARCLIEAPIIDGAEKFLSAPGA